RQRREELLRGLAVATETAGEGPAAEPLAELLAGERVGVHPAAAAGRALDVQRLARLEDRHRLGAAACRAGESPAVDRWPRGHGAVERRTRGGKRSMPRTWPGMDRASMRASAWSML